MDLSGRYVTPGIVDAHILPYSQTGWIDGWPDGLEAPEIYPPTVEHLKVLMADVAAFRLVAAG